MHQQLWGYKVEEKLYLGGGGYAKERLNTTDLSTRGRTIILSVVLYGCKTWSVTLREEHRLKVFENGVLRQIFGPKRDEVRGE
jgi:hypothetical protein